MAGAEFVDGWFVAQVLGEGAYGEVRLLQHASGARVALKALRGGEGAREAALHAALRHPHVLRCLGHRAHGAAHYLFLEWAAGGELFQRIEPDVGMCEAAARRHWRQLLAALGYLHARGVAHRDVKPENLLLAADGRLLLADFGLATVFRAGGRERRLARVAGTPPYAAPEVLRAAAAPYRAPPADLWSAAVVLLAMLVGELPWARAAEGDERFARWAAGGGAEGAWRGGPWRRVPPPALALLLRALTPEPAARATLQQLLDHPWTLQQPDAAPGPVSGRRETPYTPSGVLHGTPAEAHPLFRARALACFPALCSVLINGTKHYRLEAPAQTHAPPWDMERYPREALTAKEADDEAWRSQPAAPAVDAAAAAALWHSQPAAGRAPAAAPSSRLWLRCDERGAGAALRAAAAARGWRRSGEALAAPGHVLAAPGAELRVWLQAAAPALTLLHVRRAGGCGLDFRRRFAELCADLAPLRAAEPPADLS